MNKKFSPRLPAKKIFNLGILWPGSLQSEHFHFKNTRPATYADGRRRTASAIYLRIKRLNRRFQTCKI